MDYENCKYWNNNCILLKEIFINVPSSGSWCRKSCNPNSVDKQRKMLKNFKAYVSLPPDSMGLHDWLIQGLEDGTITVPGLKEKRKKRKKQEKEQQKDQEELLFAATYLQLLNPLEMVKNLHYNLLEIVRFKEETGRKVVDAQWFKERNSVCTNCPSGMMIIKDDIMICKKCGCGTVEESFDIRIKNEYEALLCTLCHHDKVDKENRKRLSIETPVIFYIKAEIN